MEGESGVLGPQPDITVMSAGLQKHFTDRLRGFILGQEENVFVCDSRER